ncbi:hypothetical protein [Rhizobium sp.]|uniref:hypothetical protein n=1 Tax=Rhizobium sp. TaxID=391 RepID=UPI003F7DD33E
MTNRPPRRGKTRKPQLSQARKSEIAAKKQEVAMTAAPSETAATPQDKWEKLKRLIFGFLRRVWVFLSVSSVVLGVIGGLLGIYELFYAANVTIEAPASDPKFAFEYPFKLINNSHLFAITDLKWECRIVDLQTARESMENDIYNRGAISEIGRGGYGWVDCAVLGPNSSVVRLNEKPEVKRAKLEISVSYNATLFGLKMMAMSPKPTPLSWSGDGSNPQWIVGDFL